MDDETYYVYCEEDNGESVRCWPRMMFEKDTIEEARKLVFDMKKEKYYSIIIKGVEVE